MPKISVIVPVYKVEAYLRRCVDSILAQTFQDFELILVDDGSPDNCPAICDEYAAKDSRVHVIHQKNGGLSAARNAGIDWAFANSNSKYLTFVDSDDWIHKAYLEVLYHAVIFYKLPLCMCEAQHIMKYADDLSYPNFPICVMSAEKAYTERNGMSIIACAKLYEKSLFSGIRFPYGKLNEDAFTVYKILFSAGTAGVCDIPLYYYFQNSNGIMNSKWTPKHLDEVAAHEEQLRFLNTNGYHSAIKVELAAYLRVLARHISASSKYGDRSYVRQLQKKLRKSILALKRIEEFPIIGNEWVYEAGYPMKMRIYWILKAIQNKWKRLWSAPKNHKR